MNGYIEKNRKRCNWTLLLLMLFFTIIFVFVLSFVHDEIPKIIISSLILPYALHAVTKAMDDYFNSTDFAKIIDEAKLFYETNIISYDEYEAIKTEVRKNLENKGYVPHITKFSKNKTNK